MDTISAEHRSWVMSRVRSKDTKPERVVRSLLHRMGYRFRLPTGDLPGNPDIVFRRTRKAIFVHGCFWHRHPHCKKSRIPKSRQDFWLAKLSGNRRRDLAKQRELRTMGWVVLIIWECQLVTPERVAHRLRRFLDIR